MKRDDVKADGKPGTRAGFLGRRAREVTGNVDQLGPVNVTGWVFDRVNPLERLEVELVCNGAPVARAIANLYRKDLHEAQIGDGQCAFSLKVPPSVLDGQDHDLHVREVTSGATLPGAGRIRSDTEVRGEAWIQGGTLFALCKLSQAGLAPPAIEVWESAVRLGAAGGEPDPDKPGFMRLRFALPLDHFDGLAHCYTLRIADSAAIVAYAADVLPFVSKPDSALARFAEDALHPQMSSMAGFRYEALARAVSALAAAPSGADVQERVARISRSHDLLVQGPDEFRRDYPPIAFPEVGNPRVSVVIPVHDKFHFTYHCLLALTLAQVDASFEVIVVDDGSSDRTLRLAEVVGGVRRVRHDEARGFVFACNAGAAEARGEFVVLLNNDTEVTSGWLDELLWPFAHFDEVGLTGAKLLFPDGRLQDAGGIVWSNGNPWNYARGGNPHDPRFNYARQVDYVSGACLAIRRNLWQELGGLAESYAPAYFEDTDLAFRVREKGLKTVYAPLARVVHFEGGTNGRDIESGVKRFQEINRPKFKARWAGKFRDNGPEGVDVELRKDRNVQFRALVVDAVTPMPDRNAGGYAAVQEMRLLQALGFKCTFLPEDLFWLGKHTEALQRSGIECLFAPFSASPLDVLAARGDEFDLVYITRYYVAKGLVAGIRKFAPRAKIVLNDADLHFLRELRAAIYSGDEAAKAAALRTRDEELAVMQEVDLVLTYTDVEKAVILSHNLDKTRVARCPWVAEAVQGPLPAWDERADICFLGGYNHPPNVEAVLWMAEHVMPQLRRALPGVRLRVFGGDPPPEVTALAQRHPDIVIDGWVPDVAQAYGACRVFVAPLQSGAGIKGKVVGAMAHGLPCVLSPVAAEGIPASRRDGVRVAASAREWVAEIGALYNDRAAWTEASEQARAFCEAEYGFERGLAQFAAALREVDLFPAAGEGRALALK
jgi:GT2 family glycosyltransferase